MFDQTNEPIDDNQFENRAAPVEEVLPDTLDTPDAQDSGFEGGEAAESRDAGTGVPDILSPAARLAHRMSEIAERVDELTGAIAQFPDAPANYVLRGELYLDGGDNDLAVEDFEQAIRLIGERVDTADWGYIYRALEDRAHEGLRRA